MGLEPRVHSTSHAFREIIMRGGVKALWKGSIPNVQRAALVNLGDLTTYDSVKRYILRTTGLPDTHLVHIMSSVCAGFVAAFLGTPADVVKTRVMNQPTDQSGRYAEVAIVCGLLSNFWCFQGTPVSRFNRLPATDHQQRRLLGAL